MSRINCFVDQVFKNQKRVDFHVTAKRITRSAKRRQNSPRFRDMDICGSMEGWCTSQVNTAANRIPLGSADPSWVCDQWRNPGCLPERLTALIRNLVKRHLLTLSLCIQGADCAHSEDIGFEQERRIGQQTIFQTRHRCAQCFQNRVTRDILICFLVPSLN